MFFLALSSNFPPSQLPSFLLCSSAVRHIPAGSRSVPSLRCYHKPPSSLTPSSLTPHSLPFSLPSSLPPHSLLPLANTGPEDTPAPLRTTENRKRKISTQLTLDILDSTIQYQFLCYLSLTLSTSVQNMTATLPVQTVAVLHCAPYQTMMTPSTSGNIASCQALLSTQSERWS